MSRARYIAMWSGPRNISTAMMRSFGQRADTFVCDEPLYAHYLLENGHDHPGRADILRAQESDAVRVVAWLTDEIPEGRSVFYQKQMAHHLLPDVPRQWLDRVTNAFLIREPRAMLASLDRILPAPELLDTGLPQQLEIFERVERRTGSTPPVIDSRDVLMDPPAMLRALCERLGLEFEEAMLSWPPGRRETDGVWAPHWYDAVEESTGFAPWQPQEVELPARLEAVLRDCQPIYDRLSQFKLTVSNRARTAS